LTANDLALNERYSDKTRIQVINLHEKEQAQPGDVCIDHVTNKIYLCDIGRSTVEIYDINRILQHVIDGSTMIKFKPTAITIAFDGTVIVASHFSHCLHMYSPKDSQSETNCYSYKQFKLGVQGSQIHQFTEPAGISLDSNDGYLYVCDRGNYRIQVIRPEGICERVIELFLNSRKKYQLDPVRVALQKNSDQMVCIIGLGDAICFVPKHANG
jgi:DNA-binding beta-propeller fold protein YncE